MIVAMRAQNKAVELKAAIDRLIAAFEYQTKYQITQMVITTQHAPIEGVNQITATLDTPGGKADITMQGQNVIWPLPPAVIVKAEQRPAEHQPS